MENRVIEDVCNLHQKKASGNHFVPLNSLSFFHIHNTKTAVLITSHKTERCTNLEKVPTVSVGLRTTLKLLGWYLEIGDSLDMACWKDSGCSWDTCALSGSGLRYSLKDTAFSLF